MPTTPLSVGSGRSLSTLCFTVDQPATRKSANRIAIAITTAPVAKTSRLASKRRIVVSLNLVAKI
jgi:hypothetical protein